MDKGGFKVLYIGYACRRKKRESLIYSGYSEEAVYRHSFNFSDSALIKEYTAGQRCSAMSLQISYNFMQGIARSDHIIHDKALITGMDTEIPAH